MQIFCGFLITCLLVSEERLCVAACTLTIQKRSSAIQIVKGRRIDGQPKWFYYKIVAPVQAGGRLFSFVYRIPSHKDGDQKTGQSH